MFGFSFGYGQRSGSASGGVTIETPQDISLNETTIGQVDVSWTDVAQSVDGYKVYRRLTSVGGSWGTALGTIAEGVGVYADTTISPNTEYDYKVVAYIGSNETTAENLGENLSSITTYDVVTGLLFADGDRIAYSSTKTYSGAFNLTFGIQGLSDVVGEIGLIGTAGGTANRILLNYGTNRVRANIAGGSLLTSPLLSPALELSSRKIIEIYRDGSNDIYLVDGDNPAQYLFTKAGNFLVDSIYVTGGFGTTGYLYYYDDGDQEWLIDEGSGASLVSTDTLVTLTITPASGGLPYIDGTMWTAVLPPPAGFVEFTSLSVSARSTANLYTNLNTAYTSYGVGTTERSVAEIISNGNPEGYTHAIITTGTNDVGNPTKFLTDAEYKTQLTNVVQILKANGVTPIICFTGTIVTSILQAAKNFDSTIGAMLSGDPMNPTPESDWDFNDDAGSGKTPVLPLYVTKGQDVATAESVTYANTFNHFLTGQSSPYSSWISTDGIHYTATGYNEYGEFVAGVLDTLGWTGTKKVVVLGDSLGNGISTAISNFYNA